MPRALALAATLLATLAAAAASQARAAPSAASQIASLNAQREANGIPGGIAEVPSWSEGCRRHMAYIAANGGVLTHEEKPSNPGYTADGADIARRAILTPLAVAFNAAGNAFEFAPLHLMQSLEPALSRMGVWGGCATTIAGFDRKAKRPALYVYPGDGATSVYAAERAYEMPFVPGDFVGLAQGTTTGPHILLMTHGTGPGRITSAGMTGPAGPVEIRSVDNETEGLGAYMPPGGMIIPVAPLATGSYTVTATFQPRGGAPLTRTWSFSTSAPSVGVAVAPARTFVAVALRLERPSPAGRSVTFSLLAGQSLVGRRARVTMVHVVRSCARGTCRERVQGRRIRSVIGRLALTQRVTAPRPGKGRTIKVIVETQPFQVAGLSYAGGLAVGRWAAR